MKNPSISAAPLQSAGIAYALILFRRVRNFFSHILLLAERRIMKERNGELRRFVAAGALLLAQHAAFATITANVADNGDGTFTYSYTVDNSGGSFDIAAWSLEFDFAVPDWNQLDVPTGGDVSIPNINWSADKGIATPGHSAQDFFTFTSSDDVKINATLGGFSFTSHFSPGDILFSEFSEDGFFSNSGTVKGPSSGTAVPDGGMGVGLLALGALATFGALNRKGR